MLLESIFLNRIQTWIKKSFNFESVTLSEIKDQFVYYYKKESILGLSLVYFSSEMDINVVLLWFIAK